MQKAHVAKCESSGIYKRQESASAEEIVRLSKVVRQLSVMNHENGKCICLLKQQVHSFGAEDRGWLSNASHSQTLRGKSENFTNSDR